MVTIEQAQRIIHRMEVEFDSHDFINEYMTLYERNYVGLLMEKIDSQYIFRTVNSSIGRFLADHQEELEISKTERITSHNVRGNDTENQSWIKNARV